MPALTALALPSTDPAPPSQPTDYEAFLRSHLQQAHQAVRYDLPQESVWIKRAGGGNPRLNYLLLQWLAKLFNAPVLRPVPNPGGARSVATEVRRLRGLQARGIRVPTVLAVCGDAFAMRHLGQPGIEAPSLSNAMEASIGQPGGATLRLWRQGLDAIADVHARGECLSQAVARNMVCCPDGAIGFIDFEDDPAASLPRPVCLARDALNYAQSTALFLLQSGCLAAALPAWRDFVQDMPAEARQALQLSLQKLAWVRFLPRSRRLGRDALRARAAYDLLAGAAE